VWGGSVAKLVAEQLAVRYSNGALGISDVSLQVEPGQIVVVFGPNGAGKTTTVRAISGFLRTEGAKVVTGKVLLDGRSIANLEPNQTARLGVAFVPERRKIFSNMSVLENLEAIGQRPPRPRRRELLEHVYDLFPVLADRQKELAGRLSGGQQQMLGLARTLVSEADLLIVDEMTLGLHTSVHGPLFSVVRKIADEGKAALIVDESAGPALEVADYCYLLGGGTVRMSGPPDVFREHELLAAGYVEAE
jgi:branched-chain amino acid transport system ATP-binding protein